MNGNDIIAGNYYLLYGIDSYGGLKNSTGLRGLAQFKFDLCYVWNSKMMSPIAGVSGSNSNAQSLKMSMLRPSSLVPLMLEKMSNFQDYTNKDVQRWSKAHPTVYGNTGGAQHEGWILPTGFNNNVQQAKTDWTRFAVSHISGGVSGGNVLFADGHVEFMPWTDVQYTEDQITPAWSFTSNANNPNRIVWCPLGPTD
jgi:prepilin-type processing-associated H-X9-DG protein